MLNCIICNKEIEKSKYSNKILCSSECFTVNFWNHYVLRANDKDVARIGGLHYVICPGVTDSFGFKGFGGAKFVIRFNDGRKVTTRNLWHQGTIPDEFRDRLPDNAVFEIQTSKN